MLSFSMRNVAKILMIAEKKFRPLNAPHLLGDI
jgi:hypothetical protein